MASPKTDVQKILVTLSTVDVIIEPGNVAQLVVTMTNRQDAADRLLLEVEGVDVEWYAIPVPAVNVPADGQTSERILFKVARDSANRAGSYPFLVRVQAMETGEVGVAQATLVVKPFHALQVDLNEKRAIASFFRPLNDFHVSVSNLGNIEETLDLYASDPDDGCAYEFDTDRITLKPGQTTIVPLAIRPKVSTILGGVRLYGFTVTARSAEDSYVSANAHGQLEKHALISPLLGIFLLLMVLGTGGYVLFRPHPVPPAEIRAFNAVPTTVIYGSDVTLSWDVTNASSAQQIIIKRRRGKAGTEVNDPGEQHGGVGSVTVKPERPLTIYTLVVRQNGLKDLKKEVSIEVDAPPPLPTPVIESFQAEPAIIHAGDTVRLSWKGKNYTQAILDPGNLSLSQFQKTQNVTPDQDTTYTLSVIGGGKETEKKVTVHVVPKDQCIASISRFGAKEKTVYIGDKIHLRWQTSYARTVHLHADNGGINNDVLRDGSAEVKVDTPTTFTLTATDSAGLSTSKQITVTPVARPAPPLEPQTPPTGGAGTTTTPTPPGGPPPP
jgi:hypothetical protein